MKTVLATLTCLLVLLSLAACGDDDDDDADTGTPSTTSSATPRRSPTPSPTATPAPTTGAATPLPQNICATNPDPATPSIAIVTSPQIGAAVTSPMEVTGRIAAFEAVFQITIFDAQQNKIVDLPASSNEGQTLATFAASIPFTVTTETPACLWVYEISAADGVTPIHVVQVPITLLP